MTCCPKCGCTELRVHGTRAEVAFVRRWWVGRMVARIRGRAVDVSCGDCLFAFVVRESGITEAPVQTAYDNLKAAQNGLRAPALATPKDDADEPRRQVRAVPRPAPDPRVRRR